MVQQTLKPPLCPAAGPTDLIRELEEVQSMQLIPFKFIAHRHCKLMGDIWDQNDA